MKYIIALLFLSFVVSFLTYLYPNGLSGTVVGITDGDTITVLDADAVQHKIRLAGIDAPEKKQAFGTESRKVLGDKVFNEQVVITRTKRDKYGRIVGDVYVGRRLINKEMVAEGMAWHYKQYAKKDNSLADAEKSAKHARIGLWSEKSPVAPWEYRKNEHKN